jgi:hypothetical protein
MAQVIGGPALAISFHLASGGPQESDESAQHHERN